MFKTVVLGLSAVGMFVFSGCGGATNLDVSKYRVGPTDRAKVFIPEVCKDEYKNSIPKVAVIDFTNNTTYGKADMNKKNSSSQSAAVVGIGVTPAGIIAGGASASNSKSYGEKRSVDAKLSKSVTSSVEAILGDMGGAKIYSRTDLEKILKEQKLQQSGLMDDNTLVSIGKLAGVRYIVTGSVDSVKQKYTAKMQQVQGGNTGNKNLEQIKLVTNLLIAAKNAATVGMKISTSMTVKILDVKTGEIVLSKKLDGSAVIGDIPNPTFDQVVGGVKEASMEALINAKTELSKYFNVKGYIVKLKSKKDEKIALINVGSSTKIKPSQEFFVYSFESSIDPMTNKESCDKIKLPISLIASDQITKTKTWTSVDGDAKLLKLGQLVERKPLQDNRSIFTKIMK